MKQRLSLGRDARSGLGLLFVLVASMWALQAINEVTAHHDQLAIDGGIRPRNVDHLWAIFSSPFLHANFVPHLLDNTIPFVFMGVFIALHGARRLGVVTLIVIVVSGLGTWLISPSNSDTFGASGLVFGYATYLFARGIFNRNLLEIAIGLIVGVIWGWALVSSVVPHAGVSWQDHVCGAVGGVVAAWLLSARRGQASGDPGGGRRASAPSSSSSSPGSGPAERFADLHAALDRALEH